MAKPSSSKGKKAPSIHSRSARRATSPSINTDKSLKTVRAPQESVDKRPAILAAHHNGGISKQSKRKSVLSTKARKRHEKGMERAEAVLERTQLKIQKSKSQARTIQSRKKTWDEINRETLARAEKEAKRKSKDEEGDAAVAEFYADDDEEMDVEEEADVPDDAGIFQPASIPVSVPTEEEEIL